MQAYIDHQKIYTKKPSNKLFSHLIVRGTLNDLHAFAAKIHVGKHFFHATPYPHYDISSTHFQNALNASATLITTRQLILIAKANVQ